MRLSEEVREIKTAWERSTQRDRFSIAVEEAVRLEDLRRALVREKPQIVHFSGHGGGEHGLALQNDGGQAQLVKADALARFFQRLNEIFTIECLLLNACYSEVQAEAIHQHIKPRLG